MAKSGSAADARISLPCAHAPRVSILIAAFGAERFEACLRSLGERLGDRIPVEVIAVLNGAAPELRHVADAADGLRAIDPPINLGFPAGCNLARCAARGEYLVVLQDDGTISPGWLESLVEVADAHPEAGLVGTVTAWPGGDRMIQAGWAMFSDGSFHEVGGGESPDTLDGREPYAVDTVSSYGMLVRASTWDAIGGLEEDYFPLCMVDATVSRQVWARGEAVLCAPRARAEHAASSSTRRRFREFVFTRNYQVWRDRWAAEIADCEPYEEPEAAAVRRALDRADALWRRARSGPPPTQPPSGPYDLLGNDEQRLSAGLRFAKLALDVRERYCEELEDTADRLEHELVLAAEERSRLEQELATTQALVAERDARLATQLAVHRAQEAAAAKDLAFLLQRAATLDAIQSGGWWRLRERLLPLLRLADRLPGRVTR